MNTHTRARARTLLCSVSTRLQRAEPLHLSPLFFQSTEADWKVGWVEEQASAGGVRNQSCAVSLVSGVQGEEGAKGPPSVGECPVLSCTGRSTVQ